jgi:hypothetical protein
MIRSIHDIGIELPIPPIFDGIGSVEYFMEDLSLVVLGGFCIRTRCDIEIHTI